MPTIRRKNKTWKTEKCTKQLAQIVSKNAKCHSNQHKESQLDVKNASRRTDHREASATTITDLAAVIVSSGTITDQTMVHEKCTKQLAQTAESNAKCHSNQHKANQLDAKNASAHLETR